MSELLRFHTPRNPEVISRENFSSIAIDSHRENYRSDRYALWIELCSNQDYEGLQKEFSKFLRSDQSITSFDDYDFNNDKIVGKTDSKKGTIPVAQKNVVSKFLKSILQKGKEITASDLIPAFGRENLTNAKPLLFDAITRAADTLVATVFLKTTGNIKGISYQDHLKLLFALDHSITQVSSDRPLLLNLTEYVARPIMLPPCFFRINTCTKKIDGIEFRHRFFGLSKDDLQEKAGTTKAMIANNTVPPSGVTGGKGDAPATTSPTPTPQKKDCGCVQKDDGCDCCACIPDNNCVDQNPCCATIKPYVTDLMIVKDEVKCYVAGELSYIENILMGENRTRFHRHLERNEDYIEQAKEVSNYTEKDHQSTERYSLQKETSNTVQDSLKLDAGVTFNTKYGTPANNSSLDTNMNTAYDTSKSEAHKIAENYSKDVVDRSLTKVEEKMRELVTQKRIVETEEKNKHVFENLKGSDNIAGQYFYVNKISRAQVYNYGKRLLCDILVPEPSELYKKLLSKQFDFNLVEPKKPTLKAVETDPTNYLKPTDIDSTNYLDLALKWGVKDFDFPPKDKLDVIV